MREGENFYNHLPEQEPEKEREKFCTYCYDFYPEAAIKSVKTIDGKIEAVCGDHAWMLDELGLAANGDGSEMERELADYIRDHIKDVTRRHYEFRSVNDLEHGL